MIDDMATLMDIQKRLQEQTTRFQAVAKAAEMKMTGLKKLAEEVNHSQKMIRVALGPIADLQRFRIVIPSEITSAAEQLRKMSTQFEVRYRLPEIHETTLLFRKGLGHDVQEALKRYGQQASEMQRAMEAMRSPWIDILNESNSIAGFVRLQGIGRMVAMRPPFCAEERLPMPCALIWATGRMI